MAADLRRLARQLVGLHGEPLEDGRHEPAAEEGERRVEADGDHRAPHDVAAPHAPQHVRRAEERRAAQEPQRGEAHREVGVRGADEGRVLGEQDPRHLHEQRVEPDDGEHRRGEHGEVPARQRVHAPRPAAERDLAARQVDRHDDEQ